MLNVKCRKCGKRYDDFEFDCCPRCGAYNRALRRDDSGDAGEASRPADAGGTAQRPPAVKGKSKYTQGQYSAFDAMLLGMTIMFIPIAI